MNLEQIGRVVATESDPSTAYSFSFWTSDDAKVGIGTLVVVLKEDKEVFGVVVEAYGFTDLASALHDYIGSEGDPLLEPPTLRPEVRRYKAAVLRVVPEEPLQPVPVAPVYLADDLAVSKALRMDTYQDSSGIPIGLYQNGDMQSPVYLDAEFLLGPEAAHLNLTGVSGLATKTSTIEFVLQSIFQCYTQSIAVVCFNVKGSDMLYLDFPAAADDDHPHKALYEQERVCSLDDTDRDMYTKLGVDCKPFEHVEYFAPFKEDLVNLNTLRTNPLIENSVRPLSWGLKQVLQYTEVVLNRDDIDAKADALIQYIRQRVVDQNTTVGRESIRVDNFQTLEKWFDLVTKLMESENKDQYQTHHYATIRKVHNRLSNLVNRYKGLISPEESDLDLPWGKFQDRRIYVVDVAQMDQQAQDLVFTRVVTELKDRLEKNKLGVKNVVVVVDELNKYAPSDGPETYLKKTLLDISERGRYLGLVLFSAQQFRSQVHKRIVGNSATAIYGRMDMDELATPGYQVLSSATKEKLATLSKGQLMVRHPHFNQPIFVKFPRPNVLRGPDGTRMFPPSEDVELSEAIFRNLNHMYPGISRTAIKDQIYNVDQEEAVRAMHLTMQNQPEDCISYFSKAIRRKAGARVVDSDSELFNIKPPNTGDDYDPFSRD